MSEPEENEMPEDQERELEDGELTELEIMFTQLHEGYLAALSAGFTNRQAMRITIAMLKAGLGGNED